MQKKILYISGSPCSGKSTMAELISSRYGAHYYKVDDDLFGFIARGEKENKEACSKVASLSADENWMRDPSVQCEEEFQIYSEIAPYVFEKLQSIEKNFIITEGAAYTPEVLRRAGIKDYLSIVPTFDFQMREYKKRTWVSYILKDCSDKEKAFSNWMERDRLFALRVKQECDSDGVPCIVNDGQTSIEDMFEKIANLLML